MIWTIFNTETGNGDNVEHIHSTWLVSQNKIPYKDFFQHHNPLLWYIFSPFIGFIKTELQMLDIAHSLGMLAGIIAFYFAYKISSTFFGSKLASILSLLILCPPFFYIFCFNFNPDTFMCLAYAIGLYYLFTYWQTPKLYSLVISFFSFFIAFMFTQKILIAYVYLGLLSLFVFYQKKSNVTDILYALMLPILSLILFLSYLYSKDALSIYWKTNYIFNAGMQDYYGAIKTSVASRKFLEPALYLSMLSILFSFIKGNIYIKVTSIMFVIEILERYFYFSIAPYYMLPLMIYTVCLNSVIIDKLINKRKEIIILFLGLSVYYAVVNKNKYISVRGQNRGFATYLSHNVTPCDYVLSGFLGIQSIMTKDVHYYWALLGHIDVAGEAMGIAPKPNVTELVLRYKPKLIYGGELYNNYYLNRGKQVIVQKVRKDVLEKYYHQTPYSGFYLLKPEYQKRQCQYNASTKEWLYED